MKKQIKNYLDRCLAFIVKKHNQYINTTVAMKHCGTY